MTQLPEPKPALVVLVIFKLMNYDIIIGLEIHTELKTNSKMFCSCRNESFLSPPNTNVCPICLGHPGTLPVPNREALNFALFTSLALQAKINRQTKFDRKNYFYPDLPKGYQISQYDEPISTGGFLLVNNRAIPITRLHLEEDTGKSSHLADSEETLIDFNRAGAPLIELVTEPLITSAAEAKEFCLAFQRLLRYLKVSDANMEKGEMRCEANISLQIPKTWEYREGKIASLTKEPLNNKVELKNINSFRSLERAINYEIQRQTEALNHGEKILAETRGWNEEQNITISQRLKESAADYRYFPEPDIPPLNIQEDLIEKLSRLLPELPAAKEERFKRQYKLDSDMAGILVADKALADWTEQVFSELEAWLEANGDQVARQQKRLATTGGNWIINELLKRLRDNNETIADLRLDAENFAELVCLVYQGKINSSAGQRLLTEMYQNGGDPSNLMEEMGLKPIDDRPELEKITLEVIRSLPKQAKELASGKDSLIKFFIGQVMAKTSGRANPKTIEEILSAWKNEKS
jgi:aspartyl-tRNA(Asn)/glutamyl-tRNA(Gln) amidotransferase subunit B